MLPSKCIDLTPFVREASLPPISPANGEKIQTLFGETTSGSFSPYASDGSKSITLQLLDTEFSILDAIFYPWMKDINSPWWYRPDAAYTEWATPYPMATLEVQRPRMRYLEYPGKVDSRNDVQYTYYSYKFVGVKPTSYDAFEVNGAGRSNLNRSLTLVADMCIVDLTGDVAGSAKGSANIGNRASFVFEQDKEQNSEDEDEDYPTDEDYQDEYEDCEEDYEDCEEEEGENEDDMEQQEDGDMPGEDEEEWMDEDEEGYDEDEYADEFGEDEMDDGEMDYDDEDMFDEDMGEEGDWDDDEEDWEEDFDDYSDDFDDEDLEGGEDWGDEDPNGDLADELAEQEAMDARAQEEEWQAEEEKGFFDSVMDTMSDIGSGVMDAASGAAGWLADGADAAMGLAADVADTAVGAAVDVADTALSTAMDVADTAMGVAGDALQVASDVA